MICKEDVYSLEYNMRMGDPETQALLRLMKSDYLDVILKALDRDLQDTQIKWSNKTLVVLWLPHKVIQHNMKRESKLMV